MKRKYSISKIDKFIAGKEKWDEKDIEDKDTETCEQRHIRKRKCALKDKWNHFNWKKLRMHTNKDTEQLLKNMVHDIINVLSTLIFNNLIVEAKEKHWLAVFLNPGAYCYWYSLWRKTELTYL